MEITVKTLENIFPGSRAVDRINFIDPLRFTVNEFGIGDPYELAAFMAHIGHESAELKCLCENLNYSAASLSRLFGKYFAKEEINLFAGKPEKIANRVYAGRMGNGGEESGDGWRYRGRGLIQITGRRNYSLLSDALGNDFVGDPEMLVQPFYAAMSSGWYWKRNGLDVLSVGLRKADTEREAFRTMTKRINGGYNGMEHRWELYLRSKKSLVSDL